MMRILVRTALMVAALASATKALAGDAPEAIIPLTSVFGGQLAFSADVKGRKTLFLFDTGGGVTVIAPSLAARIGCTPWGQVTGFQMRGQRLDMKRCDGFRIEAAGVVLTAPTVGVFDLLQGAPRNAPPIAGSVGLDMFAGKIVTLDVAHKILTIESPRSLKSRVANARLLTSRFERDAQGLALEPLIAATTRRGRIWFEIDSGSDGSVIVNRPDAAPLGLDPSARSQPLRLDLVGGPEIDAPCRVEDLIRDGNIGVQVLRHWIVTIDTAGRRVWIAPSGA